MIHHVSHEKFLLNQNFIFSDDFPDCFNRNATGDIISAVNQSDRNLASFQNDVSTLSWNCVEKLEEPDEWFSEHYVTQGSLKALIER